MARFFKQTRNRPKYSLWAALLFWAVSVVPIGAQDAQEPLIVPFTSIPPFMEQGVNGERAGFIVELSEMIGAEIGLPIDYLDVGNSQQFVAAQVAGQTHMIAGILKLPPLVSTNVFSDFVVSEALRPAVLVDNLAELEAVGLAGRRIGIVPPAAGSDHPILEQNTRVDFGTPQAAIMSLLSKDIDAVLLPPAVVYGLARDAGVDGRIAFMQGLLQESARHVALHDSRAELLGPINDAIATLEQDGRLDELRQRYNLIVPAPPPDVLKVGIALIPPLAMIDEDGAYSGFNVEAMADLAERAGLEIAFTELPVSEWLKGPAASGVDISAMLVETSERLSLMDFSYPVVERNMAVVVDARSQLDINSIDDLAGLKVGVIAGSIFERRAASVGTFEVIGYETEDDYIAALDAKELDAIVTAARIARTKFEALGRSEDVSIILLPDEKIKTGVALRIGLGSVRDRLNAVVPGYLVSDDYAAKQLKYFGAPVFWTPFRLYALAGSIAAAFAFLLGYLFWQRKRRIELLQENLRQQNEHSYNLSKLVAELERSNRDLDEFAYIASHDLKEPLRGIGINANFLLRDDLPRKSMDRAVRMKELTGRMEQLITDLLFFSRLGRADGARNSVNPHDVIGTIRSELSEWLSERNGEIIEVGDIPPLMAERLKLKTLLQNLVINGIKYNSSQKRRVEIGFVKHVETGSQTLENAIFVRDNGIGISEEHHDKVFRIFSRLNKRGAYDVETDADADADTDTGTGSGLAFVRKIVEQHGGAVDFTSEPGRGTTFYFTLPLANPLGLQSGRI